MKVYLGDWVECTDYGHVGRVSGKNIIFSETNEDDDWFNNQSIPFKESDKSRPWYSVLTIGGGSVLVPERCIIFKKVSPQANLNNYYTSFYFRN